MAIFKKKISKKFIDRNNHLNIAGYLSLIDCANDELLKKIDKKKFHFVAKKIFLENKKEIIINEICLIKSFLIKVSKFSIISRHEIKCYNNHILRGRCFMEQINVDNVTKRISIIEKKNMVILKKILYKNYKDPFR